MSRLAATLVIVSTALVGLPRTAGAAPAAEISAHVQDLLKRLTPHLAGATNATEILVAERVSIVAGRDEDGRLVVSTGLLAALRSDAELALVLGYELSRDASVDVGPLTRRGSTSEQRADDAAVTAGMNALVAARWPGKASLSAWDRLTAAAKLAASDDSYADRRANARRELAATRALRRTRYRTAAPSDAGEAAYRQGVLSHLAGGVFAKPPEPPAEPQPAPAPTPPKPAPEPSPLPPALPEAPRNPATEPVPVPPMPEEAGGAPWVTYTRSGGITGWTARVSVSREGRVTSSASNEGDAVRVRSRLGGPELVGLRTRLDLAFAEPKRRAKADLAYLRDGQVRTVQVTEGGAVRTLILSDGHALTAEDYDLIRVLEDLFRRP